MSKRGREKKALHVERVTAKREEKRRAAESRAGKIEPKEPRNKAALGMPAPWKRKLFEALKKRKSRRIYDR